MAFSFFKKGRVECGDYPNGYSLRAVLVASVLAWTILPIKPAGENSDPPLHLAALEGCSEMVKYL
jgi:hypothetical protein